MRSISSFAPLCLAAFALMGASGLISSCDDGGEASDGAGASAGTGTGVAGSGGQGTAGTGGTLGTAGAGEMAPGGAGGNSNPSFPPSCDPLGPQCNNCKDDDGDGLIDALDPECTAGIDNDEATFSTGIPGDNIDDLASCKQDCFFDGNSGGGDDGCQYDLRCDPSRADAKACKYVANSPGVMCPTSQSELCIKRCRSITPNGCDCFGCCALPGKDFSVRLANTCNGTVYDDPEKCPRCTPTTSCHNPCEKCEVCIGKNAPDPSCFANGGSGGSGGAGGAGGSGPGAPAGACPATIVYCGPGGIDPTTCPAGTYCITGCCLAPIQ